MEVQKKKKLRASGYWKKKVARLWLLEEVL
jgi:hypothetical protein